MIISWEGRYYSDTFTGTIGVMQVYLMSPTVFNMVVEAVIRHWDTVVEINVSGLEGFGRKFHTLSSLFYEDYRILASPRPARLQGSLDVMAGMFDYVRLQINFDKMMGMICQPCRTYGILSEVSYMRRLTRVGTYFWGWQWERTQCLYSGV